MLRPAGRHSPPAKGTAPLPCPSLPAPAGHCESAPPAAPAAAGLLTAPGWPGGDSRCGRRPARTASAGTPTPQLPCARPPRHHEPRYGRRGPWLRPPSTAPPASDRQTTSTTTHHHRQALCWRGRWYRPDGRRDGTAARPHRPDGAAHHRTSPTRQHPGQQRRPCPRRSGAGRPFPWRTGLRRRGGGGDGRPGCGGSRLPCCSLREHCPGADGRCRPLQPNANQHLRRPGATGRHRSGRRCGNRRHDPDCACSGTWPSPRLPR
ncbi:hypothetical protein Spla01_07039 [Streptomyces platensis]